MTKTWRYAANLLRSILDSQLADSGEPAAFVVFSYDSSVVYQSDYTLIRRAMMEKQEEPDVFLIEYDTMGKE